jgi:hypothetical protein
MALKRTCGSVFRFELNKLRRGRGSPAIKKGNPSYAAVSLSDIRVPLLWRPRDHIQAHFFIICCKLK